MNLYICWCCYTWTSPLWDNKGSFHSILITWIWQWAAMNKWISCFIICMHSHSSSIIYTLYNSKLHAYPEEKQRIHDLFPPQHIYLPAHLRSQRYVIFFVNPNLKYCLTSDMSSCHSWLVNLRFLSCLCHLKKWNYLARVYW